MTRLLRRSPLVAVALLAGAAVSGCTTGTSPNVSGPTQTPAADGSADLPIDVDDIPAWAEEVVPQQGDPGYVAGYFGWLSQQTSPALSQFASTLPGGDYTVTVACNGDSAIDVTLLVDTTVEIATQSIDCTSVGTHSFSATLPATGFSTEIMLADEPVVYAIAFQTEP